MAAVAAARALGMNEGPGNEPMARMFNPVWSRYSVAQIMQPPHSRS